MQPTLYCICAVPHLRRYNEIQQELAQLSTKFSNNVRRGRGRARG